MPSGGSTYSSWLNPARHSPPWQAPHTALYVPFVCDRVYNSRMRKRDHPPLILSVRLHSLADQGRGQERPSTCFSFSFDRIRAKHLAPQRGRKPIVPTATRSSPLLALCYWTESQEKYKLRSFRSSHIKKGVKRLYWNKLTAYYFNPMQETKQGWKHFSSLLWSVDVWAKCRQTRRWRNRKQEPC